MQAFVGIDMREHRDVRFVVEQVVLHDRGVADRHAERDAGMALVEGGEHLGDVIGPDRADPQMPGVQPLRGGEELARFLLLGKQSLRDGVQVAARRRQLAAPVAAGRTARRRTPSPAP